jgi:hypothetical protein
MIRCWVVVAFALLAHVPARGQDAFALIQALNTEILASRSATATLEKWCRDHRLSTDPTIVARAIPGVGKAPTPEQRQRLEISEQEDVRYRRVQLQCGERVLSIAENWYVPGRLTADMNRLLDTTTTPFGRVVQPLEPYRRTFASRMLWSPADAPMPDALFEHRAVLYTRDNRPFSEVYEIYQRDVLAFIPRPRG